MNNVKTNYNQYGTDFCLQHANNIDENLVKTLQKRKCLKTKKSPISK